MSETNLIEVKMHGIEVKGTIKQIAELKKLLDEQKPIQIKFIPQIHPNINIQPYIVTPLYPNDKTVANPYIWKNDVICGITTTYDGTINSWN